MTEKSYRPEEESKADSASTTELQSREQLTREAYSSPPSVSERDRSHENSAEFLPNLSIDNSGSAPETLSDSASPEKRRDWLQNSAHRQDINLKEIWSPDSKVLAIGDMHEMLSIKKWTADHFKELAGEVHKATAFAMEFLPKDSQKMLDDYAQIRRSGPADQIPAAREKIAEMIASHQRGPNEKTDPGKEEALQSQISMVDAAIDAGLKPLGIEPNVPGMWVEGTGFDLMSSGISKLPQDAQASFDGFTKPGKTQGEYDESRQVLMNALQGSMSPEESSRWMSLVESARDGGMNFAGLKVGSSDMANENLIGEHQQDWRNRIWASAVAEHLDGGGRVVMFAGAAHFKHGKLDTPLGNLNSVNENFSKLGHSSTVVQFAGGDYVSSGSQASDRRNLYSQYWETHKQFGVKQSETGECPEIPDRAKFDSMRWTDAAKSAGIQGRDFAVKVTPRGARQTDWLIHLKQVSQ